MGSNEDVEATLEAVQSVMGGRCSKNMLEQIRKQAYTNVNKQEKAENDPPQDNLDQNHFPEEQQGFPWEQ